MNESSRKSSGERADASSTNHAKMVGWYDPSVLVRTGIDTLVSTIFGRHSDYRLLEAINTGGEKKGSVFYDFTHYYKVKTEAMSSDKKEENWYLLDKDGEYQKDKKRKDIWIDYVADTGDGWNSTYAVAYTVSKRCLKNVHPSLPDGAKRGHILIFGGDQVYPVASRKEYNNRLVRPYETALKVTGPDDNPTDPHPFLFATPGNHDWYDSLVSFTRLVCAGRWIGGWLTRQTRSYYALKLPHNWWLLGIDVQLGSDLDGPQVRFFEEVVKDMDKGDRVILCTAEPHWVFTDLYNKYDEQYNESNLKFFEENILGTKAQVHVYLAGDLHHYRRHEHAMEDGDTIQKITAGGGGAFLHPTHRMGKIRREHDQEKETILDSVTPRGRRDDEKGNPDKKTNKSATRVFRLKKSFPEQGKSKELCRRNLLFLLYNPWFGLLTGIVYWLSSWVIVPYVVTTFLGRVADHGETYWTKFLKSIGGDFPDAGLFFWLTIIWAGFLLFTDSHSKLYRSIAGSIHGLAHIASLILGCILAVLVGSHVINISERDLSSLTAKLALLHLIVALIIIAWGWLAGSIIMGIYLWISMNIWGRHYNEAFSSLKIEDWKHFLRLHIDRKGNLVIYPIGIPTVPRRWKSNVDFSAHHAAGQVPDNGRGGKDDIEIKLIEEPIRVYGKLSTMGTDESSL
jgi:hypothetical protein